MSKSSPLYLTAVGVGTVLLVVALALRTPQSGSPSAASARESEHLSHPVPSWTLTDQDGHPFGSEQLRGRPYIANFVFTRCVASCPRMTHQMATIQQHLGDLRGRLALVSITVDPVHDTPERLRSYAERNGADFSFWHFATGTEEAVGQALAQGFWISVQPPAGGLHSEFNPVELSHAERFVLVDAQGVLRGSFAAEEEGLARLERAARALVP